MHLVSQAESKTLNYASRFPFKIRKDCCLRVACHKLTCWARHQQQMVYLVILQGLISMGTCPQVSFYPAKCFNQRFENHWFSALPSSLCLFCALFPSFGGEHPLPSQASSAGKGYELASTPWRSTSPRACTSTSELVDRLLLIGKVAGGEESGGRDKRLLFPGGSAWRQIH